MVLFFGFVFFVASVLENFLSMPLSVSIVVVQLTKDCKLNGSVMEWHDSHRA